MPITMKLNVAKNLETTASKSLFIDVPKDGTLRVRFLPAVVGSEGSIFGLVKNHFQLKSEDGEKTIAVACNKQHNDGERCILCDVSDLLKNSDDKNEREIGDSRKSIKVSNGWYSQVMPAIRQEVEDGKPAEFKYGDVKLMRLPKTGATKVGNIMKMQHEAGEPFFTDVDNGKDIVVSRVDTGVQFTQYDAMTAGVPVALDKIRPTWETDIFSWEKFWDKLDLRLYTAEEQKVCLMRSYPELDWSAIFTEIDA
jgi:hypothetical protein